MDKHFNINHRVYPEGRNQCDLDRIQNGDNSGLLHRIGNSCCWPNNSGNRITVDKVDYQSNDFSRESPNNANDHRSQNSNADYDKSSDYNNTKGNPVIDDKYRAVDNNNASIDLAAHRLEWRNRKDEGYAKICGLIQSGWIV